MKRLRLKTEERGPDDPLVGAAIGIGMTAEAAERGGADFLLALNAGRYRVMGAASIAAMLPLADSNRLTDGFARREILDRVAVPVFFGAACFDPRIDLERFAEELADAGYFGVANFPTSIHYSGRFRQALDEAGLGFGREAEMLGIAKRAGLATFGYAKTRSEIDQLLAAGVDVLCLNFGWNAGGVRGVAQVVTLDEAADRARRVFQRIRQTVPQTICVVEGGPIVNPEDMYRVCRDARADGYVGGSTVDRVPLELSVTKMTAAFKTVSVVRTALAEQGRETARAARIAGIIGQSEVTRRFLDQLVRLAQTRLPVIVAAESGLGRLTVARALHALGNQRGSVIVINAADRDRDHEELLFGAEPAPGRQYRRGALETVHGTVIVQNVERLSPAARARMLDWLDRGELERVRGTRARPALARLVAVAGDRLAEATASGDFSPDLLTRLQPGRLDVPPLRDRLEEIPAHANALLETVGPSRKSQSLEVSPDAYRLLFAHSWPGNLRELRNVLEQAALMASDGVIGSAEISEAMKDQESAGSHGRPLQEREWILDALRRNRFRRGDTAAFLGVSRKTLYNKMKRYGLLD